MAPKKLTDCPENLREAIDWLIQIRHGGDGNRLGELAKALKTLIEEAIAKAFKSHVNHLLKRIDRTCGKTDNCNSKFESIKAIEEKVNETGRANENQFRELNDHVEYFINGYKEFHYADSAREKTLEGVKAKLSEIDKLRKHLETFTNAPNDLLTNVCIGLETFLGFDPKSKGYTGKGIVYSDLDRLCDAVMAFLKGVLESVRDDDSVKTYDDKKRFNILTNEVKSYMYSGPKAFNAAIEAVAGALVVWDVQLTGKLNMVRESYNELESKCFDAFNGSLIALKTLTDNQLGDVTTKLADCFSNAEKLGIAFEWAKRYSNDVDPQLRKKISVSVGKVEIQIKEFVAVAKNDMQREVMDMAHWELDKLESEVQEDVDKNIKRMEILLQNKFKDEIQNPIGVVKTNLESVNSDLGSWITAAGEVVQAVVAKANDVYERLDRDVSKNKQIALQIKAIETAKGDISDVSSNLKGEDRNLQNWQKKATDVVTAAQGKCDEILRKVKHGGPQNDIEQKASKLKKDAENLLNAYSKAHGKLSGLKSKIEEAVKDLEGKIQEDLNNIKSAIKVDLNKVITDLKGGLQRAAKYDRGGATHFIQEFWDGMRDTGSNAPTLVGWARLAQNGGALHDALEKLQQKEGNFGTFNAVLKALETAKHGGSKDFFDCLQGDLDTKVDGKLPQEKGQQDKVVLSVLKAYDTEKKKVATRGGRYQEALEAVGKALEDFNATDGPIKKPGEIGIETRVITQRFDTISKELKDITNAFVANHARSFGEEENKGVKTLLTEIQRGMSNEVDPSWISAKVGLRGIQQSLSKLNEQLPGYTEKITIGIQQIIGELISLRDGVLKKTSGEGDVINTLNNLLIPGIKGTDAWKDTTKGLQNIKDRIVGVIGPKDDDINTLASLVTKSETFYAQIVTKADETMKAITDHLRKKVEEKTKIIQRKVKDDYCRKVGEILEKMKKNVILHITDIKKIIAIDSNTGVKGLLKKMQGNPDSQGQEHSRSTSLESLKVSTPSNIGISFEKLSTNFKKYLDPILAYIEKEVMTMGEVHKKDNDESRRIKDIKEKSNTLLEFLANSKHFDYTFKKHLVLLKMSLGSLNPKQFNIKNNPMLLDAIKRSIREFTDELDKAYVNAFAGAISMKWTETFSSKFTQEGTQGAKVFLSITSIIYDQLVSMVMSCRDTWRTNRINESSELGIFLKQCGFAVATEATSQDGQLQNKNEMKGEQVNEQLYDLMKHGFINNLKDHIRKYFQVCHLQVTASTTPPYNIYQMLMWLSALWYNPMFCKLDEYLETFFGKFANKALNVTVPTSINSSKNMSITAGDLSFALGDVCLHSRKTLIAILGNGHSGGRYSCEFLTNTDNLDYPSDPGKCFDLLVEILYRVYNQLCFLYEQCQNSKSLGGWRDCLYGKGIGGSRWQCNKLQCPSDDCDQKCRQHYSCGVKSPLQLFLEDGLPGFLPHPFDKTDCNITCSLSNHNGIPCKTPMGFTDISVTASHMQKGDCIYGVLHDFCGQPNKPLTRLCSYLICLLNRPPQTLGDMFAFFQNFLNDWNSSGEHRKDAFEAAVSGAIFGSAYDLEISAMFGSGIHDSNSHPKGDLMSLVNCNGNIHAVNPCGPYLQPLTLDVYGVFTSSHNTHYLSWIVYLTETLYMLLRRVLDDCRHNCGLQWSKCKIESCVQGCPTSHTDSKSTSPKHDRLCISIVDCKSTFPTICRYGFVFGSAKRLSGSTGHEDRKRTCFDFIRQLSDVCSDSCILSQLVYDIIPRFLWHIRLPFFYLVLALWSYSLLYLLYVIIGRLDTLHIRSHLRSLSSHRVAAQSLLAAARVGKLSNISYLQA